MKIKALKYDFHVQNIKWVCKARGFDDLREEFQYVYVFTNPRTNYVSPMGNGRQVIAAVDGPRLHAYLVPPETMILYPHLDDGVYGVGQMTKDSIELIPLKKPSSKDKITAILERRGFKKVSHVSYSCEPSTHFWSSKKRMEDLSYLIRDLYRKWNFEKAINVSFLMDAYEMDNTEVEIEWYDNGTLMMYDENHIAAIMTLSH